MKKVKIGFLPLYVKLYDDGAPNNQFLITYTLEAGKTYFFDIRWCFNSSYGYMPVVITTAPVETVA